MLTGEQSNPFNLLTTTFGEASDEAPPPLVWLGMHIYTKILGLKIIKVQTARMANWKSVCLGRAEVLLQHIHHGT